ncbi:alpha/beta fold hydrolase [Microbulbifer sp.]|uniref:alpha/beta fold hydrolase n=1 Tax=Microbulbifer sp. TaxID=1908541 RepID=UPI003F33EAB8
MIDSSPIYAIPGTMCDQQLWQFLRPQLEQPLVHIPIPNADSVPGLVRALLAQLPDTPVDLLGFSLGGYLAAALVVAAPDRFARVMVSANSPCALPVDEVKQRRQLLAWVQRQGYGGLSDRKIAQMVAPANLANRAITDCMKAMDQRLGQAVLVSQLSATSDRRDLYKPLAALGAKVTYCYGELDRLVNRDWMAAIARHAPVCELPGAGHMLPLEAPALLAREINHWRIASIAPQT